MVLYYCPKRFTKKWPNLADITLVSDTLCLWFWPCPIPKRETLNCVTTNETKIEKRKITSPAQGDSGVQISLCYLP